MLTRMMGVVLAAMALLCIARAYAADPPAKRLPVPDGAAREKALATVRDLFKGDIDKAKTPEEQSALAAKLMKTAAETPDDPVGRFVLWQFALEIATKCGDIKSAFAALDGVEDEYDVDELSAKSRTFATLAPKTTNKTFPDALALASGMIGRAVSADRYEIALAFAAPLNGAAKKFGDPVTKKDVAALVLEIKRLEKVHGEQAAASKTLETNAADPAANLAVGNYQLEKGNWDSALAYLALSDDPQFKDLAVKELAQPKENAERVAIADEWWKLGDADKTPLKNKLLGHAADLYTAALSDATGLSKKKIESRLADASKLPKSTLEIKFAPGSTRGNLKNIANSIGLKLNLIPAGEFLMGAPDAEANLTGKSEPQHKVRITKPFYLGVFPVTRGQFAQFVAVEKYQTEGEADGRGAYGVSPSGTMAMSPDYSWRTPGLLGSQQTDDHPVVAVSWNDAVAFCEWLSKKENKKYRLPSEAEWEYACRAGTKTCYNFGDWLNGTQANCNGNSPFPSTAAQKGPFVKGTTKVGSYKPNAAGLFDMHGNVFQWCADWWDVGYYANSPTDDPQGPATGTSHVNRGGGWISSAADCRSASRRGNPPRVRAHDVGFRVVLDM